VLIVIGGAFASTMASFPLAKFLAMPKVCLKTVFTKAGDPVALVKTIVELAEDRGRPTSHYLAAIPLATELRLAAAAGPTLKVCAGNCQRYGALDLLDHLVARQLQVGGFAIAPVDCLDRCDQAPACELHGDHGQLVIAPATAAGLDQSIETLAAS